MLKPLKVKLLVQSIHSTNKALKEQTYNKVIGVLHTLADTNITIEAK
ncbi:hypothetical protein SAMN04487987_10862 [Algibacter pectinivorans]|uniref:Uncharacterized protein n=1 Tax=Algibacter pectinivorans TaxID=870482 RepID=A0A1I1R0Z9_9FLAO|nr:hypothetical protein SAMN04487987_10862 [Algibacter pectinivorans]